MHWRVDYFGLSQSSPWWEFYFSTLSYAVEYRVPCWNPYLLSAYVGLWDEPMYGVHFLCWVLSPVGCIVFHSHASLRRSGVAIRNYRATSREIWMPDQMSSTSRGGVKDDLDCSGCHAA